MAKSLIQDAIKQSEDVGLSGIARLRDIKGTKIISHDDVWK